MKKIARLFFRTDFLIPLILILIVFLQYSGSLQNQLFYDDEELIYKNTYVQNLGYWPKYFTENMIAGAGKQSNMYRPILLLSFAFDYSLWKDNPFGYHLTNIFLHSLNAVFVFLLIRNLFKNNFIAFFTAILFAIHPVQTEAVAYASGRTDPLSAFFLLGSLFFYEKFLNNNRLSLAFYLSSFVFFLLAILSKESAVILPLLLTAVLLIKTKTIKSKFSRHFLYLIPFVLLSAGYFYLRMTRFNFGNTLNFYQNITTSEEISVYSQSIATRLFTFAGVFLEYLKIVLFPKELIFARNVNLINSFFNFQVFGFIVIFCLFAFFSWKNFRKNNLFLFSFIWFFASILPTSGLIPINSILAEHYLYLPSVALFLLISFYLYQIFFSAKTVFIKMTVIFTLSVIAPALFLRTFLRTLDWKNPVTFYTNSLKQSPWHTVMRHNLAMAYAQEGKLELAIKEYQNLIYSADIYPNTHHNLANALLALEKYKEAEAEYKKAIEMDPDFIFSYHALLNLYKITGETEKENYIKEKIAAFSNYNE